MFLLINLLISIVLVIVGSNTLTSIFSSGGLLTALGEDYMTLGKVVGGY
jgi:hypothetical protein